MGSIDVDSLDVSRERDYLGKSIASREMSRVTSERRDCVRKGP